MVVTKWRWMLPLGLVLALSGCNDDAGPDRRNILGSWRSEGLAGVTVRMTLSEMGRKVEGAGSWTEAADVWAFRVTGVLAQDQFSLLFDFSGRPDVVFDGRFLSKDILGGVLAGEGLEEMTAAFGRTNSWP